MNQNVIRVRTTTYKRLVKLTGQLQAEAGINISIGATVDYLLSYYESGEKADRQIKTEAQK